MSHRCQPRVHIQAIGVAALAVLAVPAVGRDYTLEFGMGLPEQSGHLQTPAGGMPGTASPGRPTLAEIGVDGGRYRWLGATIGTGVPRPNSVPLRLRFHARYMSIGDETTTTIARAFVIRGGVFDVGDTVRSRVSFDALTLALTAAFDVTPAISAELGAEVGWTAFDFTMHGERHRSERAYHVNTVGVVGAIEKDLGSDWHLGARLAAAPAIEGTGSRYMAEARLRRNLSERIDFAIGTSVEGFRYDDAHKQALPNELLTRRVVPTLSLVIRL